MIPQNGSASAAYGTPLLQSKLRESRETVAKELDRLLSVRRRTGYGPLYDLVADYPFREGKGLRPALCLAACRAVGGRTEQAVLSATALELFHNAFLIHDDIEDASDFRRGSPTILKTRGVPVSINVGDATNVLALEPLLGNIATIGVRKALLVLREVERMARESVEGQAIELAWITEKQFDLNDSDYVRMAYKKTCWYTVIAPLRIGVICGSQGGPAAPFEAQLIPFIRLGFLAGVAFQIHDDLLNLVGDESINGKEQSGDLWEGKRTVMILHCVRNASSRTKQRALRILRKRRQDKTAEEVAWLKSTLEHVGSIEYARHLAIRYSKRAIATYRSLNQMEQNDDRQFLNDLLSYVVERHK